MGLAAGNNIALLRDQIEAFQPVLVSVADEERMKELRQSLPDAWRDKLVCGQQGAEQVATLPGVDMVVSAIVGAAGLPPTVAAILAGKDIALANKETLVMAGPLIMQAVQKMKVALLPVDSEHSAIFQALSAGRQADIKKIILTASGGPFRTASLAKMRAATPEQAVRHPVWSMGAKISIDSATMFNKGLELIEAARLFPVPPERIEVLVHPQSAVHGLVQYADGSLLAQLGTPDMRTPIAHALAWPDRMRADVPRLDLAALGRLEFSAPDPLRFPALRLAREALLAGQGAPTILNAANEVAVARFLSRRLGFLDIARVVEETLERLGAPPVEGLDAVLALDAEARREATRLADSLPATA